MGVVQSPVLQVWSPLGSQAIDRVAWPIRGFGPVCRGSQLLIQVRIHPGFQLWVSSLLIWVHANQASACPGLLILHSQSRV